MLVKQLKNSLSRPMEIHLIEVSVTVVRKAAMAADFYELIHREEPWKEKLGRQDRRQVDRPSEAVPTKSTSTSLSLKD